MKQIITFDSLGSQSFEIFKILWESQKQKFVIFFFWSFMKEIVTMLFYKAYLSSKVELFLEFLVNTKNEWKNYNSLNKFLFWVQLMSSTGRLFEDFFDRTDIFSCSKLILAISKPFSLDSLLLSRLSAGSDFFEEELSDVVRDKCWKFF